MIVCTTLEFNFFFREKKSTLPRKCKYRVSQTIKKKKFLKQYCYKYESDKQNNKQLPQIISLVVHCGVVLGQDSPGLLDRMNYTY